MPHHHDDGPYTIASAAMAVMFTLALMTGVILGILAFDMVASNDPFNPPVATPVYTKEPLPGESDFVPPTVAP